MKTKVDEWKYFRAPWSLKTKFPVNPVEENPVRSSSGGFSKRNWPDTLLQSWRMLSNCETIFHLLLLIARPFIAFYLTSNSCTTSIKIPLWDEREGKDWEEIKKNKYVIREVGKCDSGIVNMRECWRNKENKEEGRLIQWVSRI